MSGRLGKVEAGNGSYTTLYAVPPGAAVATANILMANTTGATVSVNIAISTSTTPSNNDFIAFGYEIPPNGILERTALVLSPGEIILVTANSAGVICRAHGYQKGN